MHYFQLTKVPELALYPDNMVAWLGVGGPPPAHSRNDRGGPDEDAREISAGLVSLTVVISASRSQFEV
jgi:hypothetical protein